MAKITAGLPTKTASKKLTSCPSTQQMVDDSIKILKEAGGSSLFAIKKYISATYKCDAQKLDPLIKKYLKSSVACGKLIQTKGNRASCAFKFAAESKESNQQTKSVEKNIIKIPPKVELTATKKVLSGVAMLQTSDAAAKTTGTVNAKSIEAKAAPANNLKSTKTTAKKASVAPKKRDAQEKVFIIKVSLKDFKVYREIALKGSNTLYKFAETITSAFNFNFDHSFGFYSNIKNTYESDEAYTSFYDWGTPVTRNEKSVRNTIIEKVFKPKKKMIFHFDFGDDWMFLVECCRIIEAKVGESYPKITKQQGEAPPQYEIYSGDELENSSDEELENSGGEKLENSDAAINTTETVDAKAIEVIAAATRNLRSTKTTAKKGTVAPKKRDAQEKVFIIKVSLKDFKVYREIALKGTNSLYKFAETITSAFNFNFDHSFGFYSNIKNTYESDEAYTSFYDCGTPVTPNEKSVRNTIIEKVFKPKKKMIFHFDFGDDWMFLVECCRIIEAKVGESYPKITKKQGEAPPQYEIDSDDMEFDDEFDDGE